MPIVKAAQGVTAYLLYLEIGKSLGAFTVPQFHRNLIISISVMPNHHNLTSTCKLRVAALEPQLDRNFILNLPFPFQATSACDAGLIYHFT